MMHKTGRYKTINLVFGSFPFLAGVLISMMREDSPAAQQWLSIVRPRLASRSRPHVADTVVCRYRLDLGTRWSSRLCSVRPHLTAVFSAVAHAQGAVALISHLPGEMNLAAVPTATKK